MGVYIWSSSNDYFDITENGKEKDVYNWAGKYFEIDKNLEFIIVDIFCIPENPTLIYLKAEIDWNLPT